MKHFVIIDGHHLMYRAYFAIPKTLTTSAGEQVNAVFGVASMLIQILRTEQPDYLLFCFDEGEETFRHQEYAEYKSGRAETPEDFYLQIPRIQRMIETFGFKSVSDGKYEADDFACGYARLGEKTVDRVTIVSGDRDLLQLATDKVRIAIPHKGYQMPEYLGPFEIETKYGVTPAQIPSYKGLVGDSSDNLKGVPGIGPVAASAMLQAHESLAAIYENIESVKPAWRKKLLEHQKEALFCERMATLSSDMPMTIPFEDLRIHKLPEDQILKLFSELEFILLTKRFQALMNSPAGEKYRGGRKAAVAVEIVPKKEEQSQLSLL